MKVKKAVILAAGKGTRFLPFTKAYPKEMLAVVDKPALQLIVEEVVESGINEILIVISPEKTAVEKHFEKDIQLYDSLVASDKTKEAEAVEKLNNLAQISFVFQESVTGTAMAVKLAEEFAEGEPFVVLNGDDVMYNKEPVTKQLVDVFNKQQKTVVGVQEVSVDAIGKYASTKVVSKRGRLNLISDIIEKPAPEEVESLLAPLGRYVLTPDIFEIIDRTPKKNNEVYLTDSLQILAKQSGIYAYEFVGTRYDFGDKFGYIKGFCEYALRSEFGEQFKEYLTDLTKNLK